MAYQGSLALMPLDTPIPWNQKMIRHREWWLDPKNVLQGEFLHPREHEKLIFTDASNAGWDTLRSQLNMRGLVSHRKTPTYQPIGNEGSSPSPWFFKMTCRNNHVLIVSDNMSVVSYINKQGGTRSAELYALMWRILTWCNLNNVTLRARHILVSLNADSRWPLQEESDPAHRVVPFSTNLQTSFQDMGESPSGPVCNQPEYKTSSVCLSDPRSQAWVVDVLNISWETWSLMLFLPPPYCQRLYKNFNPKYAFSYLRLADKAIVLGPSGNVTGCTMTTSSDSNLTQTTTEQPLQQPPCLVSRSTALQQCGFTAEVAERIAAPQRLSTRAIYSSKWSVFQRWCMEQQVDFRNPSTGTSPIFSGIFFMISTDALISLKGTEQLLQTPSGIRICMSAPILI